jgi:hypothetical protein
MSGIACLENSWKVTWSLKAVVSWCKWLIRGEMSVSEVKGSVRAEGVTGVLEVNRVIVYCPDG